MKDKALQSNHTNPSKKNKKNTMFSRANSTRKGIQKVIRKVLKKDSRKNGRKDSKKGTRKGRGISTLLPPNEECIKFVDSCTQDPQQNTMYGDKSVYSDSNCGKYFYKKTNNTTGKQNFYKCRHDRIRKRCNKNGTRRNSYILCRDQNRASKTYTEIEKARKISSMPASQPFLTQVTSSSLNHSDYEKLLEDAETVGIPSPSSMVQPISATSSSMVQPIPAISSSMEPKLPGKASRNNMLDSREPDNDGPDNDAMHMVNTNLKKFNARIEQLKRELESYNVSYNQQKKLTTQNPIVLKQLILNIRRTKNLLREYKKNKNQNLKLQSILLESTKM